MKTQPEAARSDGPTTPASSLAPTGGGGRGEGAARKLIGAKATHPNSPGRIGTIRSVTDGYAWLEYTLENEAGQAPTITLAHYKLTELTIV